VLRFLLTAILLPLSIGNAIASSPLLFVWSGGLTHSSIVIKARTQKDAHRVRIKLSTASDFSLPQYSEVKAANKDLNHRIVHFTFNDLLPGQHYYYMVEVNGKEAKDQPGHFRTPETDPNEFTIAFGACANTGSNARVFDTIRQHDPLFFLNTGDLHYEDIQTSLERFFRQSYDRVLKSPRQSRLYRHVPLVYMWDDHDYGPNDSNAASYSRTVARMTYQLYVPHYPLPLGTGDVPIYQAFSIGRVRFILTDLRSERDPQAWPDRPEKTMMGSLQKKWFKEELMAARESHSLIVWVCSMPWIDDYPSRRTDTWNGYKYERREIANFIRNNDLTKRMCMLSGDAHMLAIDDGTHSDYADGGGAGFPVMCSASLSRYPSEKGGPHSEGYVAGTRQFALMTVTDLGFEGTSVSWSGRNSRDEELISYRFTTGGN